MIILYQVSIRYKALSPCRTYIRQAPVNIHSVVSGSPPTLPAQDNPSIIGSRFTKKLKMTPYNFDNDLLMAFHFSEVLRAIFVTFIF